MCSKYSANKTENMENKAPVESSDPTKQILQLIEKKIRNLEKRKSRLDAIREKAKNRDAKVELNEEQKEAIEKYDGVVQNIEFAKELQKSVATIVTDHEKAQKKQQKKEKAERAAAEQKRFRELLDMQALLDSFCEDKTRNDFLRGTNGATALSEADLKLLENLYELICPSREESVNYEQLLSEAAEHVVCVLDGRDRPVGSTTYLHLHQLIEQIRNTNYFAGKRNGTSHEEAATVVAGPTAVPETLTSEVAPPSHHSNEPATVQPVSGSAYPVADGKSQLTSSYEGVAVTSTFAPLFPPTSLYQRPVQDIVPASPFNFLQESELEKADYNSGVPYDPSYAGQTYHAQALPSAAASFGQGFVPASQLYTNAPAISQSYNVPVGGGDSSTFTSDAGNFSTQSQTFINSNIATAPSTQPGFTGDFNNVKKTNAQHGPQSDYYQGHGQGQGHRGHGGRGGYRGGRGGFQNDHEYSEGRRNYDNGHYRGGPRGGYRGDGRRRDDRGGARHQQSAMS